MLSRQRSPIGTSARGALYYFFFYGASAAYVPFFSVFLARKGLSGSEIGLLMAIGPLMAFLVAPSLTALADRHGWRVRMLCVSLAAMALILLIVPLPDSFAGLLPVMAVLSLVGSPIGPIADGLVARMSSRRGLSYGKMRLWGSLSWAAVAAIGGALWQEMGFFFMFPFAALLILLTIPLARLLEEDGPTEAHAKPSVRVVMSGGKMRVLLVATLAMGLCMSVGATFAGIYLDQLGGGQLLVGLFAGVTAASELPIMHWSDPIMRRFGGPWTLVLSYVLFGGSYLGLVLIKEPALLLLVAVIQGIGFGLFLPTTVRLVADWTPPEWSSTSQGVLSAGMWGLAPLIAGPLGGSVYDAWGAEAVFLLCVAAAAVAALVIVIAYLAGVFAFRGDVPVGDQVSPTNNEVSATDN
ncbi:MAG: MFS transporter [Chloroflexota bacterium]